MTCKHSVADYNSEMSQIPVYFEHCEGRLSFSHRKERFMWHQFCALAALDLVAFYCTCRMHSGGLPSRSALFTFTEMPPAVKGMPNGFFFSSLKLICAGCLKFAFGGSCSSSSVTQTHKRQTSVFHNHTTPNRVVVSCERLIDGTRRLTTPFSKINSLQKKPTSSQP